MRQLRTLLSEVVKVIIGPPEDDTTDHPWWRIILLFGLIALVFFMANTGWRYL